MAEPPIVGLTIGDVADVLGVSVSRVRQYEDEGRIASLRNLKGYRRYDPAEVERFRQVRLSWRADLERELAEAQARRRREAMTK